MGHWVSDRRFLFARLSVLQALHTNADNLFFNVHLSQVQNSRSVPSSGQRLLAFDPPQALQTVELGSLSRVQRLHVHFFFGGVYRTQSRITVIAFHPHDSQESDQNGFKVHEHFSQVQLLVNFLSGSNETNRLLFIGNYRNKNNYFYLKHLPFGMLMVMGMILFVRSLVLLNESQLWHCRVEQFLVLQV